MEPVVDIAFGCLPLRSVARLDIPLDVSAEFRARYERLKAALGKYAERNAYYLYNARCIYRLANSEVDGTLRFVFEGTVLTDRSDVKAVQADLAVRLEAETCGGVPPEVAAWLAKAVERAVLIEFDRYIAAGSLARRVDELSEVERLEDVAGFAGMHV